MGGTESLYGYRILEVSVGSPAEDSGLRPFLDFVISINGTTLAESEMTFQSIVQANSGFSVVLEVFGIIECENREIVVNPRPWEGEGVLGVSMRYEDAYEAINQVFHVTDVLTGTPAANAGLVAQDDYILGSLEYKLKDIESIELLSRLKNSVGLFVYNKNSQDVRKVVLELKEDQPIGMEIGVGELHKLTR